MTLIIEFRNLYSFLYRIILKLLIMKKSIKVLLFAIFAISVSCKQNNENLEVDVEDTTTDLNVGQSGVVDADSKPNIVHTAVGSKDHTTLVAALKAAGLVDALSNAGPFTVFAPTNAAFDKLPAGTVDGLLKPNKKDDLEHILGYHTYVGVLKTDYMEDGDEYDMVYGGKVKITKKEDQVLVNGSPIVGSIETANGIIHVIGDVLLPK